MFRPDFRRLAFLGVAVTLVAAGSANVINIQPTDDTWVSSQNPDVVKGSDTQLRMMGWFDLGAARPMLKFDLSAIPDDWTISSASLTLYSNGLGSGSWSSFPADVWRMASDNWAEGTATWNNYDHTGIWVARLQPPHDEGSKVFTIDLSQWDYSLDLLDNVVTFQMRWGDETSQQFKEVFYQSKEGAVAPMLTIDAVPEPASILVVASGVALLLRRRRR